MICSRGVLGSTFGMGGFKPADEPLSKANKASAFWSSGRFADACAGVDSGGWIVEAESSKRFSSSAELVTSTSASNGAISGACSGSRGMSEEMSAKSVGKIST